MIVRWIWVFGVVGVGCGDAGTASDPGVVDTAVTVAGDDDDDAAPLDVTYAEVSPILAAHCTNCHGTPLSGGAPFSLADYGSASTRAGRIVARAVDGDPGPMPPGGTVLSNADAATLVAWEEAGAPE